MNVIDTYFGLKSKLAVITGGTGVLGAQMGLTLARAGASVVLIGRKPESGAKVCEQIEQEGGTALFIQCDVTSAESVSEASAQIKDRFGRIDVLINAAGGNIPGAVITPDQTIHDLNFDEFRQVFDLNLMGTIIPIKCFTDLLLQSEHASVINISSMAAQRPITRVAGYSAAKAAVDNFTKWLAVEMAHKYGEKVRVNAIAPGFFITEQNRRLLTNADDSLTDRGEKVIANSPGGRFGVPSDLDGTVLWLAGKGSAFVNGVVVCVDGGFDAYSGV